MDLLKTTLATALLAAPGIGHVPQSLLVRPARDEPPCVMHVLPLRRRARDVMGGDANAVHLVTAAGLQLRVHPGGA
mgnify:CR=1 FL=1